MHLDLSQHVLRKVSRFRLRAHTLKADGIMKILLRVTIVPVSKKYK